MMEVADAAQDDKAAPPPEVGMAGRVKQWGDPWGSGWMNWPAGLVERLTIAENITRAMQSAANAKPGQFTQWEESYPDDARIYHNIIDLRIKMANHGE